MTHGRMGGRASRTEDDAMKTFLTAALAGAALLTLPLAASAQERFGGHGDHASSGGYASRQGGYAGRQGGYVGQAGGRAVAPQAEGRGFAGRGGYADQRFQGERFQGQGFEGRGERRFAGGEDWGRRGYGGYEARAYEGRGYRAAFRGYGYRWGVGSILPRSYWSYGLDPYAYGLAPAPFGYHWVLVENEALLIQDGTGAIVQVAVL